MWLMWLRGRLLLTSPVSTSTATLGTSSITVNQMISCFVDQRKMEENNQERGGREERGGDGREEREREGRVILSTSIWLWLRK